MSLSSFNELWERSALFLGTVGGALWLTRTRFRAIIILGLFVVCRLKRTCDPLGLMSFVFDFFERLLVFTGASLQRCMREILIARAPMRRLFEVFDWFNTKTTRSGVAQSFTLSTKRFVLCELDTVILVRSFKAVPLLSPNSPLFSLETMRGPSFSFGGLFCKLEVLSRTRSGAPWALIGHERTTSTVGRLQVIQLEILARGTFLNHCGTRTCPKRAPRTHRDLPGDHRAWRTADMAHRGHDAPRT
ncbi:hypothetical protein PAPYR_11478 [Paratrimastix pyriformis]|uniref:Uncharacterized protein n=1 Tax=Paratrimastix pyriformis TaxID=342808 RepID=A0ABQ8U3L8_9EUKA|nr:hypothetical protein PAPYR_11478 [Paratrimastix pyriformis]